MEVYGKIDIKQKRFKDLFVGQVFCFVKDVVDLSGVKIYMRGGHVSTDKTAINLETGIMYSFHPEEPVKVLNATLTVKELNNENKIQE